MTSDYIIIILHIFAENFTRMDISTVLGTFGGIVTALGGWELVRWLLTRKSNARIAKAKADKEEINNDVDEYHLLRERLEVADKHLLEKEQRLYEKEQRFHEQTLLLRDAQKQLLDKTHENGELKARISALETERSLKLCERKGCSTRIPQSGY